MLSLSLSSSITLPPSQFEIGHAAGTSWSSTFFPVLNAMSSLLSIFFFSYRTCRTREEVEGEEHTAAGAGLGNVKPERCVSVSGLEVGIQPGTHKLVYRNGTEDIFFRWKTEGEDGQAATARLAARREERSRRLDSWLNGQRGDA